jgi:AcrR family transcriptional regulator
MLRTDARDNRDRVLEAARGLFAERGIADVTMREIARRAEVGPATLYRRFPAKQLLVEAAFELEMQACRAIVENGCAAEDPWAGFCSIIQDFSVLNAHNHGFTEAFMVIGGASDGLVAHRTSLLESLSQVAGRAVRAGSLRRDFVIDDLVLVLLAGRGLASTAPELREAAARRFAGLAIDAFRADSGHRRLPPAPRLLPGLT